MRLRPIESDSLPSGTSSAAIVRLLPRMTHCAVGRSVANCSAIVGNATIDELVSKTVTKIPVTQTRNAWNLCCKAFAVIELRVGGGRGAVAARGPAGKRKC